MAVEAGYSPALGVSRFPRIVNIEVLRGVCPCSCSHCPVGAITPAERGSHFGKHQMALELFIAIADEVALWPEACLRFHATGEPLLWKHLQRAMEYVKTKSITSWVFTSAVTTNDEVLDALSDAEGIIEISIDGIAPAGYRSRKGIDVFALVKRNSEYLANRIAGRGLRTRLLLSRVESNDKQADKEFVSYWKQLDLASDVFVRSYHTYNGLLDAAGSSGAPGSSVVRPPCLVHWARFNISCSGEAVVCFNDLFKRELPEAAVLGTVPEVSIAEIWRGPKLEAIRKAEETGNLSALPEGLACRTCCTCQPIGGHVETSESQLGKGAGC